mmetsp:Transcript_7211/g.15738  ORF Transcript_7211/g.15738 Transcript_7211/m.15738 type:complete len:229 (-) Transcript_7211:1170-1856(-)
MRHTMGQILTRRSEHREVEVGIDAVTLHTLQGQLPAKVPSVYPSKRKTEAANGRSGELIRLKLRLLLRFDGGIIDVGMGEGPNLLRRRAGYAPRLVGNLDGNILGTLDNNDADGGDHGWFLRLARGVVVVVLVNVRDEFMQIRSHRSPAAILKKLTQHVLQVMRNVRKVNIGILPRGTVDNVNIRRNPVRLLTMSPYLIGNSPRLSYRIAVLLDASQIVGIVVAGITR